MSKGGYFMLMQTIASESGTEVTDSTHHSEVEIEPLFEVTKLPWGAQAKVVQDVRSLFEQDARAVRSISPSKFLELTVTFLKNAHERDGTEGDIVKCGLDLLLTFLSGNRKAIESLEKDLFEMLCVFLLFELVAEEAMITLKNLSSSNEICEMVSLGFVMNLTSFLQQGVFSRHSITILKNLCNTEKGRVCVTETPGCLASISELLDPMLPRS